MFAPALLIGGQDRILGISEGIVASPRCCGDCAERQDLGGLLGGGLRRGGARAFLAGGQASPRGVSRESTRRIVRAAVSVRKSRI